MELALTIVGLLALVALFLWLRSRARWGGRPRRSAPLRRRLNDGDGGLRWSTPVLWRCEAEEPDMAQLVDDERGVVWQLALLPYGLDLAEESQALLLGDVEAAVRATGKGAKLGSCERRTLRSGAPCLETLYRMGRGQGAAAAGVWVGQCLIPLAQGIAEINVSTAEASDDSEAVRGAMTWLLEEANLEVLEAPESLSAAPRLELPWAGCEVGAPPRYVPVACDFPRSETMDVLSRISLGAEAARLVDVYRVPASDLEASDREGLETIARDNAAAWATEGAGSIRCDLEALDLDDGRTHLANHIRFEAHGQASQTYAHWFIDGDGAVFRVGAHGPGHVAAETLAADARYVVESLRR